LRPVLHLLCLTIFFLSAVCPSHAADLPALIAALGAEDFDGRVTAVDALGAFGDGHAIPALQALNDGNLYTTTADKRVVIAEAQASAYKLTDPVTLAALGEAASDAVD
jgi:urea transport system permease protein